MRIYEFAKKHGIETSEILMFLTKEGIVFKSHMSVLSDEALVKLDKFIKKQAPETLSSFSQKKEEKKAAIDLVKNMKQDVSNDAVRKNEMQKESPKSSFSHKGQHAPKAPLVRRSTITSSVKKNTVKNAQYPRASIVSEEAVKSPLKPFAIRALSVGDFAQENNIPVGDLIVTLLKQGKVCTKNYILPEDLVKQLCQHYAIEIVEAERSKASGSLEKVSASGVSSNERKKRLPVVVVMGHVDHGKTSLLDFIRKTRVAAREKGGITQHLGAYQVKASGGELVFLDTPGHEAFSKIRKRGISVADVVVLVIAADDGIMPQTVECIKIIKSLNVPVVVAINKVDKVEPQRLEIVKRQLSQYDLLPEEWGGSVICVPVSAKSGEGIEHLLEMLILQSEMLELDAAENVPAQGYVLEAKMAQGKGIIATIICYAGTLTVGDFFKVEDGVGKVVSITDSYGSSLKQVGASLPVIITGFTEMPMVGGILEVITEIEYKKLRFNKEQKQGNVQSYTTTAQRNKFQVIVKADTFSSLEAILDAFTKQFAGNKYKEIIIIRSGIGNITESDALLAETTQATILGFSIKVENNALAVLKKTKTSCEVYDIIYKLFEKVEELAAIQKEVKKELKKIGNALVVKTFDVKKLGVIAGCIIKDGRFNEKGTIVVVRQREEIFRGKLKSLQRDKKNVREVHSGFECAFIADGFNDWQEDDIVDCYLETII